MFKMSSAERMTDEGEERLVLIMARHWKHHNVMFFILGMM